MTSRALEPGWMALHVVVGPSVGILDEMAVQGQHQPHCLVLSLYGSSYRTSQAFFQLANLFMCK